MGCGLTGGLLSCEWLALLSPTDSENADAVIGLSGQSRQGEVATGGRQTLVLGPPAPYHLVA